MNNITHYIDKDGNVVIDAVWNNTTFGAVIIPEIIAGRVHISKSDINTEGVDNAKDFKEMIIKYVTTYRGKNKEMPLIIMDK